MRRRTLLATPPLLALLAACSSSEPAPTQPTPAAPAAPVEDPAPRRRGEVAPRVAPEEMRLPLEMTPMIVVDPGWTATPQQLDGVFVGYRESEDWLTYLAVDQDGTVLWEADRPLSCTGFTLTRGADDRPLVVLADLASAPDSVGTMTLTGYDLRTAEPLWGPVAAPGAQAALGLVFAEPTNAPMGAGGPRTALSGADGEVAVAEAELAGGRVLAEHLGTILTIDGATLIASNTAGQRLWTMDMPADWDLGRLRVLGTIDTVVPHAVVADPRGAGLVIDLSSGTQIATAVSAAAHDHVHDVTVLAAGTTVRGLDADGREQWRHEDPESLDLISAGERLAYAMRREEGTLVVLDTLKGLMVNPYDVDSSAPLAMPELFSADAAAVVRAGERRCLVTTVFDEHFGTRE